MDTVQFEDRKASVDFYQQRYEQGYMGHWSDFDKKRIFDLVKSLNLPANGMALDFGCGRGIFTQVIQEALPGWKIFGCDINNEAVNSARKNNNDITFFVIGDSSFSNLKFDFIHTHHILEHTYDLRVTAEEINSFAAEHCSMLHSLPCNHEGSLEYKLSNWRKDGFDPVTGKFFFEDSAHIRRLNVDQAEALFAPFSFLLQEKYFSNQFWGAIKWIAESSFRFVWRISNPFRAKNAKAFFWLARWRKRLRFAWFCFFAASAFSESDKGKYYFVRKTIQVFFFLLFFWMALPVKNYITRKAKKEWEEENKKPNGSDMFLVFRR